MRFILGDSCPDFCLMFSFSTCEDLEKGRPGKEESRGSRTEGWRDWPETIQREVWGGPACERGSREVIPSFHVAWCCRWKSCPCCYFLPQGSLLTTCLVFPCGVRLWFYKTNQKLWKGYFFHPNVEREHLRNLSFMEWESCFTLYSRADW